MKITFAPPYIDEDVIKSVEETLRSGWITSGPKVKALEEALCDRLGVKGAVCVNSWTSGATLVLKWLGVKPGDEVIVPAYTYCATAMAVMDTGATPVMVDINDNFTIDTDKIEQAITPKTKAIIPVDLGGIPCDYDKIRNIVESEHIKSMFVAESRVQEQFGRIMILSDSAHSIGAKYKGNDIARVVDVCVLSFHAVKNITSAEGGAICFDLGERFDNDATVKWFKMMTLNGQTKDAFAKAQMGAWKYDIVAHGMKINLPDVNAAIALAQIGKYDYLLQERKRVYDHYRELLQDYHWAVLPPKSGNDIEPSYHLFLLKINPITEQQRNELINLMAEKGVATNVHYIPMPLLSLFSEQGYKMEDYPVSFKTYQCEISLPIYPQLSNLQVEYVVNTLVESYYKVTDKM